MTFCYATPCLNMSELSMTSRGPHRRFAVFQNDTSCKPQIGGSLSSHTPWSLFFSSCPLQCERGFLEHSDSAGLKRRSRSRRRAARCRALGSSTERKCASFFQKLYLCRSSSWDCQNRWLRAVVGTPKMFPAPSQERRH